MKSRYVGIVAMGLGLGLLWPGHIFSGKDKKKEEGPRYNLVYVPTPEEVVDKMFQMAKVTKDDLIFDLGCGDGRIVAMAAKKYKARGVGVDINPERIKDCMETIKKYEATSLVEAGLMEYRLGDALKVRDLQRASVIMLYMLPEFMEKLEPQARALKPGSRIVAHDFSFSESWKPDQVVEAKGPDRTHTLYLYTVREKK